MVHETRPLSRSSLAGGGHGEPDHHDAMWLVLEQGDEHWAARRLYVLGGMPGPGGNGVTREQFLAGAAIFIKVGFNRNGIIPAILTDSSHSLIGATNSLCPTFNYLSFGNMLR